MPQGSRSPRADHAARTRRALIDTALKLFSTQGYDNTATDEIAEAAGVSPRTFFRYFPTKESVLFFGEYDFIQSFTGLYLAQPDSASDIDAMRECFVTLAPGVSRLRDRIKLYRQAVASSLTLRGRERRNHEENAETIAVAIADRRGLPLPDPECDLLASLGLLVLDRSMDRWLNSPGRKDLGAFIQDEFASLRAMVCTTGPTGAEH
jgi:AcrR family transcriptional regulator